MKVYPSLAMWRKFNSHGNRGITALHVASTIADILAGWHVAHSATELLLDLKLMTMVRSKNSGMKYRINKQGKLALSAHLHAEYHGSTEPLIVVPPDGIMTLRMELPVPTCNYGHAHCHCTDAE